MDNLGQLIDLHPLLALATVFVAGVAVSFTPCIYPIVPVTLGVIGARSAGGRWRGFALSSVYGFGMALTYAVIGTLVAAMAVLTRARDLITSILVLPLCIPLIIGASQASEPLLSAGAGGAPARWLAVLALYDLIFGLLAWALFDYLVED